MEVLNDIIVKEIELYYVNTPNKDGEYASFWRAENLFNITRWIKSPDSCDFSRGARYISDSVKRTPVENLKELTDLWNRKTDNGKGWYLLKNQEEHKPDLCIIQRNGITRTGSIRYRIYLFKGRINVTRFFERWKLSADGQYMITHGYDMVQYNIEQRFGPDIKIINI